MSSFPFYKQYTVCCTVLEALLDQHEQQPTVSLFIVSICNHTAQQLILPKKLYDYLKENQRLQRMQTD